MTWILLPYAFLALTLTATGPVVTGELTGFAAAPCPVVGSFTGSLIGAVAVCEATLIFAPDTAYAAALAVLLRVDPATLEGTWRIGAWSGTLQRQAAP